MKRFLGVAFLMFAASEPLRAADVAPDESIQLGETFVDDLGQRHGLGLKGHSKKHGILYWAPKALVGEDAAQGYDARQLGQISTVKNQGSCGSCWAFAITKAFESSLMRAGRGQLDLSEQQVVSCDTHAFGCGGGYMDDADYVVRSGQALESAYPYTGSNSRCKSPLPVAAAKPVRWGYIGTSSRGPTLDEIKAAFKAYNVLFTTVAAGGSDWGGSRVHMTSCGNRGINHMVGLAGVDAMTDELIIANSWGGNWGESGYAYAKQGCNLLASGSESVGFIEVEGGPVPQVPRVRLPERIQVLLGTEVMVGVRPQAGVTYSWEVDGLAFPSNESTIFVTPEHDSVYKLKGHTAFGDAESSVEVHVSAGFDFE